MLCVLHTSQVSIPLFMSCKILTAQKSVPELPQISKVPGHQGSFRFVSGVISWISEKKLPSDTSQRGRSCHHNLFVKLL